MSVKGLENLETWCRAKEFALRVYREILPQLPSEEKWNLGQQLRRSASSIPANIAEGHGRYYYQENIRFCYIARGSLEETLSHIALAFEMEYLPDNLYREFEQDGEKLSQLLNGYIGYLKRSKRGANEPGANYTIREAAEIYGADILETDFSVPENQSPIPDAD